MTGIFFLHHSEEFIIFSTESVEFIRWRAIRFSQFNLQLIFIEILVSFMSKIVKQGVIISIIIWLL